MIYMVEAIGRGKPLPVYQFFTQSLMRADEEFTKCTKHYDAAICMMFDADDCLQDVIAGLVMGTLMASWNLKNGLTWHGELV